MLCSAKLGQISSCGQHVFKRPMIGIVLESLSPCQLILKLVHVAYSLFVRLILYAMNPYNISKAFKEKSPVDS